MSLINEMLRDLEARGGNEPDAQIRSAPESRAPRRSAWPMIALGTIVLCLLIAIMLLSKPTPESGTSVAATLSAMERGAAPVRQAEPPATGEVTASSPALSAQESAPDESVEPPVETAMDAPAPEAVVEPAPPISVKPPAQIAVATTVETNDKRVEPATVIVRRHEPTREEIAARAGRDGFAALRNGDWATAARLLQELVAFEPANDDAREGLAVALTRQGRIAEADGTLIDGVALGAVPARFAKLRARVQASRGELDAALASLSIAVPDVSADPEYHALKAALAQQAERYDVAATTYSTLTVLEPANATWQAGLGMALDKLGDISGARDAYERALASGRQLDTALLAHVQRRINALSDQEK